MKKVVLSICFLLATFTMVSAQNAAAKKEAIKKGLKEQVMLTDEQITSVMNIENDYRPKLRTIKIDSTMSEADRKTKTKALNDEKKAKLETLLGKEKAGQTQTFLASLKKEGKGTKSDKTALTEKKGKKGTK